MSRYIIEPKGGATSISTAREALVTAVEKMRYAAYMLEDEGWTPEDAAAHLRREANELDPNYDPAECGDCGVVGGGHLSTCELHSRNR